MSIPKKQKKYNQKNIKRVPLDMQITKYTEVKAAADQAGESVNGYIKAAIDMRMARETKNGSK